VALSFLHPFARPTGDVISLGAGLQSIAADGPVDHASGAGASCAVGTNDGQHADRLRARMLARGGVTRAIAGRSLTFCPPLITTDPQVDQIIDTLAVAASE